MYLLKEKFDMVLGGGGGAESRSTAEVTKEKIKDVIAQDLDMSSMFAELEQKDAGAIFQGIIDEDRTDILEKNDKFLKNLELAKSGDYMAKDEYFLKKRKRFLLLLSKTFFFSNIKKKEYKVFRNYVSVLGKLKDDKKWSGKHEVLLEDNNQIMDIVKKIEPGELGKLEKRYQKTVEDIVDILNIKDKDFTEHDFHNLRKKIRFVVYVMRTLNKYLKGSEHGKYKSIAKKYDSISESLANIREVTGQGELSWKKHAKNILKKNIANSQHLVSRDVLNELPDLDSEEMQN